MNSRRKFLTQGSLSAAALMVTKPLTSFANNLAPITGFSINNNSLVLAHTGNVAGHNQSKTLAHIIKLKRGTANLLMLHAGSEAPETGGQTVYDASTCSGEQYAVSPDDYRIVYKGDIKTGVITATNDNACSIRGINELSAYLKNEKSCQLVVCMSQLGYKTKHALNDLELAEASTHLDVIIGDHAQNFSVRPVVAMNRNKAEVILNYAGETGLAFSKIEIDFDASGNKNRVVLNDTV